MKTITTEATRKLAAAIFIGSPGSCHVTGSSFSQRSDDSRESRRVPALQDRSDVDDQGRIEARVFGGVSTGVADNSCFADAIVETVVNVPVNP